MKQTKNPNPTPPKPSVPTHIARSIPELEVLKDLFPPVKPSMTFKMKKEILEQIWNRVEQAERAALW